MQFRSPGYSGSQFDNVKLRRRVEELKLAIPFYLKHFDAQAIAVTGKSGMSMAFATLSHIDFPLIVVRKGDDSSHGYPVEGTEDVDVQRYLILDDLVASGTTVRRIVAGIAKEGLSSPACVGCIMWDVDVDENEYEHSVRITDKEPDGGLNERAPIMGTMRLKPGFPIYIPQPKGESDD